MKEKIKDNLFGKIVRNWSSQGFQRFLNICKKYENLEADSLVLEVWKIKISKKRVEVERFYFHCWLKH